jgi:hypothetical protein
MAIKFLQVSPEIAVESIQDQARKGYALRHAMQSEHDMVGSSGVTDDLVAIWIDRINKWSQESKDILLKTFYSATYMYKFIETTPNIIHGSEEQRFTNLRHGLIQRVGKLDDYVDFIIGHSNPTFTFENNITYLNLNPKRDINIAGRDIRSDQK